jgi:hypothetical protein
MKETLRICNIAWSYKARPKRSHTMAITPDLPMAVQICVLTVLPPTRAQLPLLSAQKDDEWDLSSSNRNGLFTLLHSHLPKVSGETQSPQRDTTEILR